MAELTQKNTEFAKCETVLTTRQLLVAQETMKWCLNYVTPLFIADPPDQPNAKVYANGTAIGY
ncbi:MAG: hypothetical protein HZB81_07110 [Deltaproteobacteria bacterium]|nr:hypothetical protein [Deltaproteobacteria bacterium]